MGGLPDCCQFLVLCLANIAFLLHDRPQHVVFQTVRSHLCDLKRSGVVARVAQPGGVGEPCLLQPHFMGVLVHLEQEQFNRLLLVLSLVELRHFLELPDGLVAFLRQLLVLVGERVREELPEVLSQCHSSIIPRG